MAQAVGIDRSSFMASIKMESFENEVRTAWKYTCSSKNPPSATVNYECDKIETDFQFLEEITALNIFDIPSYSRIFVSTVGHSVGL